MRARKGAPDVLLGRGIDGHGRGVDLVSIAVSAQAPVSRKPSTLSLQTPPVNGQGARINGHLEENKTANEARL